MNIGIRQKKDLLLSKLTLEEKELILDFLIESQIIEYGIIYILTGLPFLKGPNLKDIGDKSLGVLINELEKTESESLLVLALQAKEFNYLRKDVIHNLLFTDRPTEKLVSDIKGKILLAKEIQNRIEAEFNNIFETFLDIPYGNIF